MVSPSGVRRSGGVLRVTLLGACIALLGVYLWLAHGEAQENRYATYAEAREALRRGWLPTALPKSASEIHEWHERDINVCFGSFRFDPREWSATRLALRRGLRRTIRIDRDPSFASVLPLDPSKEQLTRAGFEFYSGREFDFAISWKAGIAYYWNSPS